MRFVDLLGETAERDRATLAALSSADLSKFARYKLAPEDIAFYVRLEGGVEPALARIEKERLRGVLYRAADRAVVRIQPKLDRLLASDAMMSPRVASAAAANNDELFGLFVTWVSSGSDAIEDDAAAAAKMRSLLKRVTPVRRHLFRGEGPHGDAHSRGFHSWTENRSTAEMFAERHGRVLEIDEPVQGISIADLIDWRMKYRPNESHYGGPQAEWLIIDPPSYPR